jgi:hypothetical protein
MKTKFASRPDVSLLPNGEYDIGSPTVSQLLSSRENWNYVVMNDHTQSPARSDKKIESMKALEEGYIPLLKKTTPPAVVIFIQTAAYKSFVKDSQVIGSFDEFTTKLWKGYTEYVDLLKTSGIQATIAPVGLAYQHIKQTDPDLWSKLYGHDDFHPSPHGTLLEASMIYSAITNTKLSTYDINWWNTARYMQPPDESSLPLPTNDEASMLIDTGWMIYQETLAGKQSSNL